MATASLRHPTEPPSPDYDRLVKSVVQDFSLVAEVLQYIRAARKILADRLEPHLLQLELAEVRAETALKRSDEARQEIVKLKGWEGQVTDDEDVMERVEHELQGGERTQMRIADERRDSRTLGRKYAQNILLDSRKPSKQDTAILSPADGAKDSPKCPFASMGGDMPEGHPPVQDGEAEQDENDPIATELAMAAETGETASVNGSTAGSASTSAKCPIRFLDKHSPEEVARYFEQHKHEIPRSHELCVKRYQSNQESIRRLDAKYGNLVSMIQGLGSKHQPYLHNGQAEGQAAEHDEDDDHLYGEDKQQMRNWAARVADSRPNGDRPLQRKQETKEWEAEAEEERVVTDQHNKELSERSHEADKDDGDEDGEERRHGRFDREWKEVRLGESPSRPWGIAVPESAEEVSQSPDPKSSADTGEESPAPESSADMGGKFSQPSDEPQIPDVRDGSTPKNSTKQSTRLAGANATSNSAGQTQSAVSSAYSGSLNAALAEACTRYFSDWKKQDDQYQTERLRWIESFESWRRVEEQLSSGGQTLHENSSNTRAAVEGKTQAKEKAWHSGPPPEPPAPPKSTSSMKGPVMSGSSSTDDALQLKSQASTGDMNKNSIAEGHGQPPLQIVITGPVFFGYGAKETERLVNAAK